MGWVPKTHQESVFYQILTWQQNNILLNLADRVRVILFSLSPGLKNLTAASFKYLSSWKPQYNTSDSWIMEKTNYYSCTGRAQTSVVVGEDRVQEEWKSNKPAFRMHDTSRLGGRIGNKSLRTGLKLFYCRIQQYLCHTIRLWGW